MSRLIIATLVVLLLLPFSGIAHAQNSDPCSPENIHAAIDNLIFRYETLRSSETSTQASLLSLGQLERDIAAIRTNCEDAAAAEREAAVVDLLTLLYDGGYVIYVRHTETDRSQSDTDLSQCESQRNLNEQGRDDARMINDAWTQMNVPVSRLLSTQYCRTLETAELAFGEPEVIDRTELRPILVELLSTPLEDPTGNFIIVAHIGTLQGETGLVLGEGDAIVFEPLGEGDYAEVGRITLDDWLYFAEVSQAMQSAATE